MTKNLGEHVVCLTFDFDTESGFVARDLITPTFLSRGEFGLVGASRILESLERYGLPSTWFIPGFTIESHPKASEDVVAGGHEIAHHSWSHIPPANQSRDEEHEDLVRANEAILRLSGKKARGYRSPSWDLSENTIELLISEGMEYDSSMMGGDYLPTWARKNDIVELGNPIKYGDETNLIEMPISWSLDDYPHFEFMRTPNLALPGLNPAKLVMEDWWNEFQYMKKTVNRGVLTYTMHPYVIGRGYRMFALEKLLEKLIDAGATFMKMEDAAQKSRRILLGSDQE